MNELKKIIVDEIVQVHTKNGITNRNRVMNGYLIYQWRFQKEYKNPTVSSQLMYKLASEAWKQESKDVKEFYKDISKRVKAVIGGYTFCTVKFNAPSVDEVRNTYINIDFSNKQLLNHYMQMSEEEFIALHPEPLADIYKKFLDEISHLTEKFPQK